MHPKIFERRKAVGMGRLEYVSPEEWPKVVAEWVSRFEGKLPRPENYRKKNLPRLRKLLRHIDDELIILSGPGWGDMGENLSAMYGRHRGHVVKELTRRMVRGGGA